MNLDTIKQYLKKIFQIFNLSRILFVNISVNLVIFVLLFIPIIQISSVIFISSLFLLIFDSFFVILNLVLNGKEYKKANNKKSINKPPEPILPENKTVKHEKIKKKNKNYLTKEDLNLDIPQIPEAPKKQKNIAVNSEDLSIEIMNDIRNHQDKDTKVVLVNCQRCNSVIAVPIKKKLVKNSELPVVPISYVHKNRDNDDRHCITLYIDHDFDIRRDRISDIILSENK